MLALRAALVFSLSTTALATAPAFAHGGGCRKSSPPGQCCHLQTSTGTVHCH